MPYKDDLYQVYWILDKIRQLFNKKYIIIIDWATLLTSRVDASVRTQNQPFFCQSGAAKMQNELVEGVWLGLFLFLLIPLLLLHRFLGFTGMIKVNKGLKLNILKKTQTWDEAHRQVVDHPVFEGVALCVEPVPFVPLQEHIWGAVPAETNRNFIYNSVVSQQWSACKFWLLSYLGMLYNGVILKQATTALRLCLDNSLCQTIFFDLNGCSV